MAGLSDVLKSAVAAANGITSTLQASVSHAPFVKYNRSGEPLFGAAVSRTAIVEKKQQLVRSSDASERMSHTKLTFVGPVVVDVQDKITLPGGTSPKILAVASPLDGSGAPLITEVWF